MFWKKKEVLLPDLWAGAGGTYAYKYRDRLDEVAKQLTGIAWENVYTLYDKPAKCVVIRSDQKVFARIQVHGECGLPYRANVRTNLLAKYRDIFDKAFVGIQTRFESLNTYIER